MSGDNWETSAMDEVKQGSPPANPSSPELQLTPPDAELTTPLHNSLLEPINTIFFGPQGLRAGWRLLLYIVMWRALRMLLGVALEKIDPHVRIKLWLDLITEVGSFGAVAFRRWPWDGLNIVHLAITGFPDAAPLGSHSG